MRCVTDTACECVYYRVHTLGDIASILVAAKARYSLIALKVLLNPNQSINLAGASITLNSNGGGRSHFLIPHASLPFHCPYSLPYLYLLLASPLSSFLFSFSRSLEHGEPIRR